ncbi:unnamed protein product [Sphenostylis stenocarpa]|uniref:Uncharacterized protein n=1 Tax=Sphenostylis stenocarpa TaxID=92480 RepID=A0AA86V760_9FABA|nr:unnamed protein product [Sphenostylis stenocarpa]
MRLQKVTVMGWAEQKKVLKAVRKTGRRAELWPYPYNPEHHALARHYANDSGNNSYFASSKPSSSYNYYKHGYSYGEDFGYYHKPIGATLIDEKAMALFSDDNPHACSIM